MLDINHGVPSEIIETKPAAIKNEETTLDFMIVAVRDRNARR